MNGKGLQALISRYLEKSGAAPAQFADRVHELSVVQGLPEITNQLNWVFVLNLPNSGSTAFAQILATAPNTGILRRGRGGYAEGQWLLPDMSAKGNRWAENLEVDFDRLRHVWQQVAGAILPDGGTMIEKSPPNMLRIEEIVAALGCAERSKFIILVRDPLAVCASWVNRYGRADADDSEECRRFGATCGERMALLATHVSKAQAIVHYEDLTENPVAVLDTLQSVIPELRGVKPKAPVTVKDYDPQALTNMNERQISTLSDMQIGAIHEGLAPYREAISLFGYESGRDHQAKLGKE